ncbi:MAG: 50S ribosomal protein L17 [Deltaproteobacteria bacterium]|jgi:large subunit ribosomal protein L17|nr:50S ribosomal protein L17 [Deltaproteobacteria bacterium]
MRHRNSGRKLGRTREHRKALFRNLATAILVHGRITTTEPKAKEIRGVVEPLITMAQSDTVHARRQAYRVLGNHQLVKKLFDIIAPEFKSIPGGYTRLVKLALPRKGDCAPLAIIELTRGGHLNAVSEGDKDKGTAERVAGASSGKTKKAKTPKVTAAKSTARKSSSSGGNKPKSTHRKIGS